MCSYLNQLELADWINRLQIDASDPLSGKGWEVLVVLAAAFRKAAEQKAQRTSRRLTELRLRGLREGVVVGHWDEKNAYRVKLLGESEVLVPMDDCRLIRGIQDSDPAGHSAH
mmetsp:Transcript_23329/g.48038  ORF Transcript_23329/g.48038 Transcript_23329/m.48038 type:complete len:113 (+) Transcript_23329:486-824(+)